MAKNNAKKNNMGKTKRSTDDIINDSIAQQNAWQENRRSFAKRFLKTLNVFAKPAPVKSDKIVPPTMVVHKNSENGLAAYWFPVLCAIFVILVAIWVAFIRDVSAPNVVIVSDKSNVVAMSDMPAVIDVAPEFDVVRIEPSGEIIVAGHWVANKNISIVINKKIVATIATDNNGDFVYAPKHQFNAGNYTISLLGANPELKSTDSVFVYISPAGYENSVSLLMTSDGSTLLQSPTMLRDGDLAISKIDYLSSGRVVVSGDSLPRLRVSLALDDKYLGWARVSDNHHFGLGADIGELEVGRSYTLTVRLHDGDGRTVAQVGHRFVMPEMTGDDDTFYTVRRGDCLWIIARNFLRRGILFSIIADRNNIENPDLIFPKQILEIPVGAK